MRWQVDFDDAFLGEFQSLSRDLQEELLSHVGLLKHFGPALGRPYVDTLKASKHKNMKELRFDWNGGVWRVAFAFDPRRQAILLVAGDKAGTDQKRFYKKLIEVADRRFDLHVATLHTPSSTKPRRN